MGKGDKRSKKGKRWRGSYGKTRLRPGKLARVKALRRAAEKGK